MNKKQKTLFLIFLGLFVVSVSFLLAYTMTQKKQLDIYDELAEEVEETVTPAPTAEPTVEEEPMAIPVDFDKLWETNRDIYAWIEIPGTDVSYPIVQHESDDLYYLDHTIEGAAGLPGSIYTESYNEKDFSDCNTVIYGHNMKNGTMFGSLSEYQDETYGDKFAYIKVYTPEHIFTYQVFAAVTYDNRHILYHYGPTDKMALFAFLNSLESDRISGWIDEEKKVTGDDKIIVLSTCNGNSSQRFLVGAVLTDEE